MTGDLDTPRHIHFVGIAGTGMSALARYLLDAGHTVSGSDRNPGEAGELLARLGACVTDEHAVENLRGADFVVTSPAVPADNLELEAARRSGIPNYTRAQLLAAVSNRGRGIAVAGTHGKTTTSSLIAHILIEAGRDPSALVGGIANNLQSNARHGHSDLVVVEADEFAGAFLELRPSIGVITNVEPEHLDYYGTLDALHDAFRRFAGFVTGTLVICADDPILPGLVHDVPTRIVTYGVARGLWHARDIAEQRGATTFTVEHAGGDRHYRMSLGGVHNVRNALAGLAVAERLDIPADVAAAALASFSGVERRLERKGEADGVLVMDDYAHHPTEIRSSLAVLKPRFGRPVRLIFQPHTYSRTKALLPEFATSFGDADAVYLMDIYAARERRTLGISGRDLYEATRRHHGNVRYVPSHGDALAAVRGDVRTGDLVITMGAGDVDRVGEALLRELQA